MDNAIIGNLALNNVEDKVESQKPSRAIRLSELSIKNVKKRRKYGLLSMVTKKVANKKINKEIEKYQQNIKELTEKKEEFSGSKYMIEQGIVDNLDNKIKINEKTIIALQRSKEIIHIGNKPLRLANYMIKFIKEKTNKKLKKIDSYQVQNETESNMSQSDNLSTSTIENSSSTIGRVRPMPSTARPKIDVVVEQDSKQTTEINPIDALVKETMARQNKVEARLKEEQNNLREATEQKNNNIIELQKAIEARNKQIAEKEAELQRRKEKVEKEREEAARIEAALKLLGNNSEDNNLSKSM